MHSCVPRAQGGDLQSALRREQRLGAHEFDWINKGKEVALAVAKGLHFLHTSGVIHRCHPCRRPAALSASHLFSCRGHRPTDPCVAPPPGM